MAIVRSGDQCVLLVVDVQVGVMRNVWESARIVQNIRVIVDKARSQGVPVIWVQHSDDELVHGSPDWQLAPELNPVEGEVQICKRYNSSFEETPLEEVLAQLDTTRIVLAGAATNWCIRATAYAALERGYDLTLVSDAHTTGSQELEDGTRIEASHVIQELNLVMTWISYPGRTSQISLAAEVDF